MWHSVTRSDLTVSLVTTNLCRSVKLIQEPVAATRGLSICRPIILELEGKVLGVSSQCAVFLSGYYVEGNKNLQVF